MAKTADKAKRYNLSSKKNTGAMNQMAPAYKYPKKKIDPRGPRLEVDTLRFETRSEAEVDAMLKKGIGKIGRALGITKNKKAPLRKK